MHPVIRGALTDKELATARPMVPIVMATANGDTERTGSVTLYVPHISCHDLSIIEDDTVELILVSLGQLIEQGVCDFHWARKDGPYMCTDKG